MIAEHAERAPSAAERWVPCPGSVELEAQYPNEDTDATREGIAAHHVLASMLTTGEILEVGSPTPNGVAVTDEMIWGAELGVSVVDRIFKNSPERLNQLMVESRVSNDAVHGTVWGTPDLWWMDWKTFTLRLLDYKFGHGYVEVFENWQLVIYVALILEHLRLKGWRGNDLITVEMTIIQPRWYGSEGQVRSWTIAANDLRPYFDIARAAVDQHYTASGPWCLNCMHRAACPTLFKSSRAVMDYVGKVESGKLTDEFLGRELDLLEDMQERLKSLRSGLELEAQNRIKNGHLIYGYGTEMGYSNKKWTAPAEEVAMLGDMYGYDLRKPLDVITPTQALNKKGIDVDVLEAYCARVPTGLKLVKQTEASISAAFK